MLLSLIVATAIAQKVPAELLSHPARLELDKPTTEVKSGATVNYTVVLKNARGQAVPATSNLQLAVQTPSGTKSLTIPAGQSSAAFSWTAGGSGVAHMSVTSGKLYPASGLVLVTPSAIPTSVPHALTREHPLSPNRSPADFAKPVPQTGTPVAGRLENFGRAGGSPQTEAKPVPQPAPAPPPPAATAVPYGAVAAAKKIQLYIEPLPVYGNALDHAWSAKVSVAVLGDQDALVPVSSDVPVEFHASSGHLSPASIVLHSGQYSNFDNPVVLTTDRAGSDQVDALSSLGSAVPVEVKYLLPPPAQLRLSLDTPVLSGSGDSTAHAQVCLLDQSGALTFSGDDTSVTLSAPGQLASSSSVIPKGTPCSQPVAWTSSSGSYPIHAEAVGLKADTASVTFPAFPWYLVWLAAAGGLVGALVRSGGDLSAHWFASTWRSLALGVVLGVIFYLFARFGAIGVPKDSPVDVLKIPPVRGVGAFLLGFLGGVFGRKLWKIDGANAGQ